MKLIDRVRAFFCLSNKVRNTTEPDMCATQSEVPAPSIVREAHVWNGYSLAIAGRNAGVNATVTRGSNLSM